MGKILESFKAKNEERKQKEAAFKNSKFYKPVLKNIYILTQINGGQRKTTIRTVVQ